MISSTTSHPRLTDEGGPNIFRMAGRDDQMGRIAGHWLADQWRDAEIASSMRSGLWQGLAEEVRGS